MSRPASVTIPAMVLGVYGIVAWNGKNPNAVGHHHMLAAFADDAKTGPSQGANGAAVVDARNLGHR